MDLADLSIRRPIFITSIVLVTLVVGWFSFQRLPVDLFPNVEFPLVTVTTAYPGAGPEEVETLVTKAIEEEISTLAGLKRVSSRSLEGYSQIVAEFRLGVEVATAEQQVRDKVGAARPRLPGEVLEPVVQRIDPSALPVMSLSVHGDLAPQNLYDIAESMVKPRLQQVSGVGLVEVVGGRKREIHVELDRAKLAERELSVSAVAGRISTSGQNVPSGSVTQGRTETVFRTLGEFKNIGDISNVVIDLFANAESTKVSDVGRVTEALADEKTRVFVDGEPALILDIYRQSGSNTIAVADGVRAQMAALVPVLQTVQGVPKIEVVRDASRFIRNNIADVEETIILGIILTVLVVYLFLANGRSTIITGLALPNSLIGAFILMAVAGFSVNVVTLLALTLAIGLLIDDAIVVRENIFRHMENGEDPLIAARTGTAEVKLAVIATTLVVIAVFAPVGFMGGIVGRFMREFGLTICFAMLISTFDALTIAPMLSAYFAGSGHGANSEKPWERPTRWGRTMGRVLQKFDAFQGRLEEKYEVFIRKTLARPKLTLGLSLAAFVLSSLTLMFVPKTFLPEEDPGEFNVTLELPAGANLERSTETAREVDRIVRNHPEVELSALTVGGRFGESNIASIYVKLVPRSDRDVNTTKFKEALRTDLLTKVSEGNPKVVSYDPMGAGQSQPINLNLIGENQQELEAYANRLVTRMKQDPRLRDVGTSLRTGKPEFQIQPNQQMMQVLGLNTGTLGAELRAQVEGVTPARFREDGREYDVRVRLLPEQRDLKENFDKVLVPNVNYKLVRLADVAKGEESSGPASIDRQDRGRYVQIMAGITPGVGLSEVVDDLETVLATEVKLPPTMRYAFVGDAENYKELISEITQAMILAMIFIFLVLASLYESFVTPFTIMLALPMALCGAFFALFISGKEISLFSILGIVMLLGIASKNSILLVDYARHLMNEEGFHRIDAIVRAGRTRLRPILMTSMALIAGTIPVAIGLNESSAQRTSMGFAIIGGMVSSTVLSLVVIPLVFLYVDRFRVRSGLWLRKITGMRRRRTGRAIDEIEAVQPLPNSVR